MMHTLKTIIAFMLLLVMMACGNAEIEDVPDCLVVEGYIDAGGFPIVILTRSIHVTEERKSMDSLANYVERWARVAVDDGERTVVLTGMLNETYYPPYIYTTGNMRGEEGKQYKLTVDLDHEHVEAVTTIPQRVQIDSTYAVQVSDTLYSIHALVRNEPDEDNYYMTFAYKSTDRPSFLPSALGVQYSNAGDALVDVPVNYGRRNIDRNRPMYYHDGDSVMIKVARINKDGYDFWRAYEDMNSLSSNPLMPVVNNLPSNIEGGLGYWMGYGADYRRVVVSNRK